MPSGDMPGGSVSCATVRPISRWTGGCGGPPPAQLRFVARIEPRMGAGWAGPPRGAGGELPAAAAAEEAGPVAPAAGQAGLVAPAEPPAVARPALGGAGLVARAGPPALGAGAGSPAVPAAPAG